MSALPKAPVHPGSRIALRLDRNGLTVYANGAGLASLADRLLRLAAANPNDCFECHTRSELGSIFFDVGAGEVSLVIDQEIDEYFSSLPADAPADARPAGFELTFMHVNATALDEYRATS